MKTKFLLTGGSGVLGTELQKQASEFDIEYVAPSSDELNITSDESLQMYLRDNYDLSQECSGIVHCAAFTDVPGAEKIRKRALNVNALGTKRVQEELTYMFGNRTIYISTDYVYPGISGNYKETDRTQPVNFYAVTKLAGEVYLNPSDLIIRTSFKPKDPWPHPKAFTDLYTSADYVDVIAKKISNLIAGRADGIYNVGTERKSIYELAKRRNSKVKPMSVKDITSVHLPSDISMNLDRYNELYGTILI